MEHSNALHSSLKERGAYFVGPLARYGLNFDRLPPTVQQLAKEAGLPPVCKNPFQSIVVRAIETVYAVDEALRILAAYEPPDRPWVVPRSWVPWISPLLERFRLDRCPQWQRHRQQPRLATILFHPHHHQQHPHPRQWCPQYLLPHRRSRGVDQLT